MLLCAVNEHVINNLFSLFFVLTQTQLIPISSRNRPSMHYCRLWYHDFNASEYRPVAPLIIGLTRCANGSLESCAASPPSPKLNKHRTANSPEHRQRAILYQCSR